MSFTAINKRILKEISSQTKDPLLNAFVQDLLQIEMENWEIQKWQYTPRYEKEIESMLKKKEGRK